MAGSIRGVLRRVPASTFGPIYPKFTILGVYLLLPVCFIFTMRHGSCRRALPEALLASAPRTVAPPSRLPLTFAFASHKENCHEPPPRLFAGRTHGAGRPRRPQPRPDTDQFRLCQSRNVQYAAANHQHRHGRKLTTTPGFPVTYSVSDGGATSSSPKVGPRAPLGGTPTSYSSAASAQTGYGFNHAEASVNDEPDPYYGVGGTSAYGDTFTAVSTIPEASPDAVHRPVCLHLGRHRQWVIGLCHVQHPERDCRAAANGPGRLPVPGGRLWESRDILDSWYNITGNGTFTTQAYGLTNGDTSLQVTLSALSNPDLSATPGDSVAVNFFQTATLSNILVYDQNGALLPTSDYKITSASGAAYPLHAAALPRRAGGERIHSAGTRPAAAVRRCLAPTRHPATVHRPCNPSSDGKGPIDVHPIHPSLALIPARSSNHASSVRSPGIAARGPAVLGPARRRPDRHVITFDDVPDGTVIDTQYQPKGVTFSVTLDPYGKTSTGQHVYARTPLANDESRAQCRDAGTALQFQRPD